MSESLSNNKSPLELMSEQFRNDLITKNTYNFQKLYGLNHPNAISDGDDKGKNEIGNLTDIQTRTSNLIKNEYSPDNEYSSNHKNVISDGDDKGKSEIGGISDINTRRENIVKILIPRKHYFHKIKIQVLQVF